MQINQYKKHIVASVTIAVILLFAEVVAFWNVSFKEKNTPEILPFILAILIVFALGYALNLVIKATDNKALNELIEKEVNNERLKILKEFEKKEDQEKVNNNAEIIQESLKKIVPKGSYKNIGALLSKYFKNLANELEVVMGILYIKEDESGVFSMSSGYALTNKNAIAPFKAGETIPGQVAQTGEITYINDVPDDYFSVESGLGSTKPKHIAFLPLHLEKNVVAVIEIALFKEPSGTKKEILLQSVQEMKNYLEQTIKS
ncbi:MAG: GAF domain-containing protein [Bacteroidales bacterium]|nr:GAF domain-containing protein [Bacteroidales bacterium]